MMQFTRLQDDYGCGAESWVYWVRAEVEPCAEAPAVFHVRDAGGWIRVVTVEMEKRGI